MLGGFKKAWAWLAADPILSKVTGGVILALGAPLLVNWIWGAVSEAVTAPLDPLFSWLQEPVSAARGWLWGGWALFALLVLALVWRWWKNRKPLRFERMKWRGVIWEWQNPEGQNIPNSLADIRELTPLCEACFFVLGLWDENGTQALCEHCWEAGGNSGFTVDSELITAGLYNRAAEEIMGRARGGEWKKDARKYNPK